MFTLYINDRIDAGAAESVERGIVTLERKGY